MCSPSAYLHSAKNTCKQNSFIHLWATFRGHWPKKVRGFTRFCTYWISLFSKSFCWEPDQTSKLAKETEIIISIHISVTLIKSLTRTHMYYTFIYKENWVVAWARSWELDGWEKNKNQIEMDIFYPSIVVHTLSF